MKKLIITILLFSLVSCNGQSSHKESEFTKLYESCEMNTVIKMSIQKWPAQPDEIDRFDVLIENFAEQEFVFSYTSNLEIWRYDNSTWLNLANNIHNLGADELYIAGNDFRAISIIPVADIDDKIRVAVTGNFIR